MESMGNKIDEYKPALFKVIGLSVFAVLIIACGGFVLSLLGIQTSRYHPGISEIMSYFNVEHPAEHRLSLLAVGLTLILMGLMILIIAFGLKGNTTFILYENGIVCLRKNKVISELQYAEIADVHRFVVSTMMVSEDFNSLAYRKDENDDFKIISLKNKRSFLAIDYFSQLHQEQRGKFELERIDQRERAHFTYLSAKKVRAQRIFSTGQRGFVKDLLAGSKRIEVDANAIICDGKTIPFQKGDLLRVRKLESKIEIVNNGNRKLTLNFDCLLSGGVFIFVINKLIEMVNEK